MLYFILIFFSISMLNFSKQTKNFLSYLISLEFFLLISFILLSLFSLKTNIFLIFFFIISIVCEASLGLATLSIKSYFINNDLLNNKFIFF